MRKSLAELLREAIDKRHLTQKEAATQIGTDPANVSRWLTDGAVSPRHVQALCRFLGIKQDELGAAVLEGQMRRHAREIGGR